MDILVRKGNQTYEECLSEFMGNLKRGKECHHKVRNSWGVYDAYKYYRKNKPKGNSYVIKDVEFYKILRAINKLCVESFIAGSDINLPHRMGKIILLRRDHQYWIDEKTGWVKTTRNVQWEKTHRLWFEDEEAAKEGIVIRDAEPRRYTISYMRSAGLFKNISVLSFIPNRAFAKRVHEAIENGDRDTFITKKELRKRYAIHQCTTDNG